MFAIFGLGNPGKEYELTRHNIGFLVVDRLATKLNAEFAKKQKFKAELFQTVYESHKVAVIKPQTYMNLSGQTVQMFLRQNPCDSENILVICDDFNLEFGQLRLRSKGGDGGHNGIKSIITELNTQRFSRLRIGINLPHDKNQVVDYVLGKFKPDEQEGLSTLVETAADCCLSWMKDGIEKTMEVYNRRKNEHG